ncbi:MAG TPA: hypothetical protein VHK90_12685 [Thermoanaerobaculia bacterium]|nr:hypothetical protein [Thermoanaerobaculia bacterium]
MRPFLLTILLALSFPLFAQKYHLELEATPEAAFPWLSRFGKVDIHVYQAGVRGEALWLNGFSRNGEKAITVANPLGRMYVDVAIAEIAPILTKLAGSDRLATTGTITMGPVLKGAVGGIPATRHRIMFGPQAWIDYWTTDVVPPNEQFRTIVNNVVRGISPGTAAVASKVPGTPVYVELNFRRFKKVPIVKFKKLSYSADDEDDALTLGPVYVRASVLEKLFGVR